MKFPILIKLGNNRTCHIVNSIDDLPIGMLFRIVKTGTDIEAVTIETEYRRVDEPEENYEEPPEDRQPLGDDSANNGAGETR